MSLQKQQEYVDALEKERDKIAIFRRDLPLSLDLLDRVIKNYRGEICKVAAAMPILVVDEEEERCVDDSTPILKEFIPLKPTVLKKLNEDDDDDEGDRLEKMSRCSWLKSAQLWNNDKKTLSSPNKNENKFLLKHHHRDQHHQQRKERRCWSPELHRRFVHTLQILGGPHVATPKQIRQILQVDDLTNDEVKSHLQKYRMHAKWSNRETKINGDPKSVKPVVMWEPRGLTYSNQLLGHRIRSTAPFQH
ncbi:hypothetical protein ZOSMA_178G00480 [Zostera marina]|uniref:HTH myb-type domain-containing protein n=1 Tax=Zostera marina TaxID=29655 RepID=A0A0K9PRU1_ZOSMR|nr:hypothetical protein ZOSMA_178G00480 [Zostera marina]